MPARGHRAAWLCTICTSRSAKVGRRQAGRDSPGFGVHTSIRSTITRVALFAPLAVSNDGDGAVIPGSEVERANISTRLVGCDRTRQNTSGIDIVRVRDRVVGCEPLDFATVASKLRRPHPSPFGFDFFGVYPRWWSLNVRHAPTIVRSWRSSKILACEVRRSSRRRDDDPATVWNFRQARPKCIKEIAVARSVGEICQLINYQPKGP